MQELNCLIIEDEPLAVDVLKDYINDTPGLCLLAVCNNAVQALELLRTSESDILFVDIHLPKLSGIDFVKSLQKNYHIIFTTAYHQYAVDGFTLNAADYLLKPIAFPRFLQAVNKVFAKYAATQQPVSTPVAADEPYMFFNVDRKQMRIHLNEVCYFESLKDYIRIHTQQGKVLVRYQIGTLEQELAAFPFLRVHKSYLVNSRMITAFGATHVELMSLTLPIGRSFRDHVLKRLGSKR